MNTKKIGRWSSAIGHSATISRKRSGRGTISEIEEEEGSNRGRVTALIAQLASWEFRAKLGGVRARSMRASSLGEVHLQTKRTHESPLSR